MGERIEMIWIECVLCFFNFYNVKIQRKWARRGEEKRGARGRLDERGKEEACYKYHNMMKGNRDIGGLVDFF